MTRQAIDDEIVRIMIDDGPDGHCDGHEMITDYVMTLLESLVALLRESKHEHYHCDDHWYCCGKCDNVEHVGPPGVAFAFPYAHGEGASGPARVSGVCNCGADAWNAKIEAVLNGPA